MAYRNHTMDEDEFEYYIFEKNLQGDIVAVYDEYRNAVVKYTYDAWGNVTETLYDTTSNGQYNSFRYRGYFYDEDTELYYLNSRYYDPATGRFLNPDIYVNANGDLTGFNMYAYCSNNPVMGVDETGCKAVFYQVALKEGSGVLKSFECEVYEYKYYPSVTIIYPFLGFRTYEMNPQESGRIFIFNGKSENDFKKGNYDVPEDFDWNKDILVGDLTDIENPNMHVYQAQNIPRDAWDAVIDVLLEHDRIYCTAWNRTKDSLVTEWKWHMNFQKFSTSAQNVDFDNYEEGKNGEYYVWKAFLRLIQ